MSYRKIVTALALMAGCAMATIAVPTSAFAADSHTAVTPASCSAPNYNNGIDDVGVNLCGWTVTGVGAQSYISFYGHMEFYGPHGFIGNSADLQYSNGSYSTIGNLNQSAWSGSLWCVRLWERTATGYTQLDNNCVTL